MGNGKRLLAATAGHRVNLSSGQWSRSGVWSDRSKVVCALSGGVDSSVVAFAGPRVWGTLYLHFVDHGLRVKVKLRRWRAVQPQPER